MKTKNPIKKELQISTESYQNTREEVIISKQGDLRPEVTAEWSSHNYFLSPRAIHLL